MSGFFSTVFDSSPEGAMARKLGISKQALQDVFNEFDTDGSGSIESHELQALVATLGMYWDADQTNEALKAMDDGNGTVEIGEFAKWFVSAKSGPRTHYLDYSGEYALKMALQARLIERQISNALKAINVSGVGRPCTNTASVSIGEVDPETCRGQIKAFVCPASSEEFASLNPPGPSEGNPQGAKVAAWVDISLRDGYSPEDLQSIKDGCNQMYSEMLEPMLEEMNAHAMPPVLPPGVPPQGKPFHSYRFDEIDGCLRVIVFSGIDVASLWRDSGLEMSEFVPTFHKTLSYNFALSDFLNPDGPSIAEMFAVKMETEFTWNTKILKALRAVLKTDMVKAFIQNEAPRKIREGLAPGLSFFARVFKGQSSNVSVSFNGFSEFANSIVSDVLLPQLYGRRYAPKPVFPVPSDEEVAAIVDAVGKISGSTFAELKAEAEAQLKYPNPMTGDGLCSLYYMLKFMTEQAPVPPEMVELGWKAYKTFSGIKKVSAMTELAQAGVALKGFDPLTLGPTQEEIMASTQEEGRPDMYYLRADTHPLLRALFATVQDNLGTFEAADSEGINGIPPVMGPEGPVEGATWSYDPADLTAFAARFPQLMAVVKAAWPQMLKRPGGEDGLPLNVAPIISGMKVASLMIGEEYDIEAIVKQHVAWKSEPFPLEEHEDYDECVKVECAYNEAEECTPLLGPA
jgi:hypothetical protein